jgi:hypothetical protein
MGTRCFVGVHQPAADTVTIRYVHSDGTPDYIVATLRAIWRHTVGGDTTALATGLVAHTWSYLGADVTADTNALDDEQPVPGFGMAMHTTPDDETTNVAVDDLTALDVAWVYLIDPDAAVIAVHHADSGAEPVARHRLAG